jgi:FtsZ-binding cell division protein ZapB
VTVELDLDAIKAHALGPHSDRCWQDITLLIDEVEELRADNEALAVENAELRRVRNHPVDQ